MPPRPVPLSLVDVRAQWPHLLHFADISKWQKDVDYAAAAAVLPAVIIKASGVDSTSGVLHIDGRAIEHSRGFARLPQGFYHYAKQEHRGSPAPSGREQAVYFIRCVDRICAASGVVPRLLALDLEEVKEALGALKPAELSRWVRDFIDVIAANRWGALPVIYTSASELRPARGVLDWIETDTRLELWIAGYPRAPQWPSTGPDSPLGWAGKPWGAWQWTSDGICPGFKSGIDLNVARRNSRIERALGGRGPLASSAAALPLAMLALALALYLGRASLRRALSPLLRRAKKALA